jgi:plasmid stabilization system protein ParE
MRRVRLAAAALRDVEEAIALIAADNPHAAERVAIMLRDAAASLAEFPLRGVSLPGARPRQILTVPDTPFRIVFSVTRSRVMVLRIWHGARGWPPVT